MSQKKFSGAYLGITAVKTAGNSVEFTFENGDILTFSTDELSLLVPEGFSDLRWSEATVVHNFFVSVLAKPETLEIPVDVIRGWKDPEFNARIETFALKQCTLIGQRLQENRLKKCWNIQNLANRTGIAPDILEDIERGHPILYQHWDSILDALGLTRGDLFRDTH